MKKEKSIKKNKLASEKPPINQSKTKQASVTYLGVMSNHFMTQLRNSILLRLLRWIFSSLFTIAFPTYLAVSICDSIFSSAIPNQDPAVTFGQQNITTIVTTTAAILTAVAIFYSGKRFKTFWLKSKQILSARKEKKAS